MEDITIDNVVYKKASSVARDFGYTTDYVGQLCRGGKVRSKLIGRSWYVDPTSLTAHKSARQRSTAAKSKLHVQQTIREKKDTNTTTGLAAGKTNPLRSVAVSYEADESDLHPVLVRKTASAKSIPVELGDAVSVKVNSVSKNRKITRVDPPTVRFKGRVKVQSGDTIPADESPTPVEKTKEYTTRTIATKKKSVKKINSTPKAEARVTEQGSLPVDQVSITGTHRKRKAFLPSVFCILLGIASIFTYMALEHSVVVTTETGVVESSWSFSLDNIPKNIDISFLRDIYNLK